MGYIFRILCKYKKNNLQINTTEIGALIKAFTDASGIRANGLHIGGVKYIALKADDRSVYGKKVKYFYKVVQGAGGVVCVKTKQAVLIGVYDEPIQPGEATKVVEGLADYLISVSYVRIIRITLVNLMVKKDLTQ